MSKDPASHPVEVKIGNQEFGYLMLTFPHPSINHGGALRAMFCLPIRNVLERKRKAACPPEFDALLGPSASEIFPMFKAESL